MVWLGFKQELNQVYFIIIIYRNKTQHFLLFRLDGVKRNFIVPVCYYCYYTLNLWSVSFLSLISSIPWSVLPLIRFTLDYSSHWSDPFLDQFYSLISSIPWSVLFLDQFYLWSDLPLISSSPWSVLSLISSIPWSVLFLDQFHSLIRSIPWSVLFLD